MYKLILVRHGQSVWNQENRFTGWTDVDLSERGMNEAREAGAELKAGGFNIRYCYTSMLTRAIKTLNIILDEMGLLWLPVEKTWRLNEKHYGFLQGMNKKEMVDKYGSEQVQIWRRSFSVAPPAIPMDDPRHPAHDIRYESFPEAEAKPGTESLLDTTNRIIPLWENNIRPKLQECKEVLIAAHGNSLRGLLKHLKQIPDDEIAALNIPTGVPLVLEFDDNMKLVKDYYLIDEETLKKKIEEVANQTKK
ncbi:MAG: 2,3-diphosphoglycerate-dependent phosphoglycerate mutase [Bacteroidetes bacterium]|nr:2,3-diphosphoglycerate-dependent phosphoglycerate mutase [Bacteroidota bacterium]